MFSFNYKNEKVTGENLKDGILKLDENLQVTFNRTEIQEFDAYTTLLWFENVGKVNTEIISDICDCDTILPFDLSAFKPKRYDFVPDKNDMCVISMTGMVDQINYWRNTLECPKEFSFNRDYLPKFPGAKKCFENRGGRSSDGLMPIFDVTYQDDGYIVAIGWTGDWKAEIKQCSEGALVKTGLKETNFYLEPSEKIRTSSVLVMKYNKNEDKYNKFRSLIKNHFSHVACTNTEKESIFALQFFGSMKSEMMKERINELLNRGINFEEVWIDAGWYGKCEANSPVDWDNVGDWEMQRLTHPEGLKDVSNLAKANNMKLMLWFEPERAKTYTKIVEEHPEWILKSSNPENKNCIVNYGNRDALEHMFNMLTKYIDELDIGCYRQDFNVELTEFFKLNDTPDRRGITEIKHIMGLYELWDRLLEKYPSLLIDNCSSGGRRFDIETLKRSIPFFRTDYQVLFTADPEVIQVHNNGAKYLPYLGCTTKVMTKYALRSAFSTSFGFQAWSRDHQEMSEEDFETLKVVCDEYLKIRKYFSCEYYSHGSNVFDTSAWTIWQYNDKETQSGVVIAFRRSESPFDNATIKLKGLRENQKYSFHNFDTNEKFVSDDNLSIKINDKKSSVIIEYKLV